ncbi:MAG: DHHA1 domain-containing protein [Syntrophales bacterium]
MNDNNKNIKMSYPFPKSTSARERVAKLLEVVDPGDTLGVLIDADPDAMASAIALGRLLWRKAAHVLIYRINPIKRADNLAFIDLLKVKQLHISQLKKSKITRWAIVDSQPHHNEEFMGFDFDIIIDHHPVQDGFNARFIDIRENYGATSTIMTEYLRAARIKPSTKLATALFCGIKTDTANFTRECLHNDIDAFRYLHSFANMNIIKKIESSEMTKKTLDKLHFAIEQLTLVKKVAYVHMGKVDNPDVLVIVADFFIKMAEALWSVVSGVWGDKVIIIMRTASFRKNAGKVIQKLFGHWGGSAGGHLSAARAEIPLSNILKEISDQSELPNFIKKHLTGLG